MLIFQGVGFFLNIRYKKSNHLQQLKPGPQGPRRLPDSRQLTGGGSDEDIGSETFGGVSCRGDFAEK